jgi:hypothetical protein
VLLKSDINCCPKFSEVTGTPPIAVPAEWLKFGSEPDVLQFIRGSAAGFTTTNAAIVVSEK